MKVVIFGATGMVGQGVLRECLLAPDVQQVVTIGRSTGAARDPKLREIIHPDLLDLQSIETDLAGFDSCFFAIGITAAGTKPDLYRRITFDTAISAATTLSRLNPDMTFVYVSAQGADSSERGRIMWARVKGETENALRRLPFRAVYCLRPGLIQPLHGARSKTAWYRVFYSVFKPLLNLARGVAPNYLLTTEQIGRAMLNLARHGAAKSVLTARDIRSLAQDI